MALESENQMLGEKIEMKSKEKKSTIGLIHDFVYTNETNCIGKVAKQQ